MTTTDLVAYLKMSRVTLWRKRKDGDFPQPCAIGGQLRWRRRDVDGWLDKLPAHDPVGPPAVPVEITSMRSTRSKGAGRVGQPAPAQGRLL